MDKMTAIIVVFALLVLAFVAFFAVFRSKGRGRIKGPFGMSMEVEGENKGDSVQSGIRAKDVTSETGAIIAQDETGRGVNAEKLKARGDVNLSSRPPPKA